MLMSTIDRSVRPRVAVLGATGCVGRHTCAAFANEDYEVIAVARRFAPQVAGYRFHSLDIADMDSLAIADLLNAERVDVVVNASGTWVGGEKEMQYSHVRLVERLTGGVAAMRSRPRLVHIGTIHEYGPVSADTPIDERTVPDPQTLYGRTKLAGSEAVLQATEAGRLDGVVLRLVNVFGPDPSPDSFLGSLSASLRTADPAVGLDLTIADVRRDYVDVRDAAAAVVRAAHAPITGCVINIGRGEALSMRELVYAMVATAGLPRAAIREQSSPVQSKGGDWTQAAVMRARDLLSWAPRHTIAESIKAMLDTAVRPAPA
jgi:NDP-hexose 4-ketoreductase